MLYHLHNCPYLLIPPPSSQSSFAKWVSVRLRNKWFWVRIPLLALNKVGLKEFKKISFLSNGCHGDTCGIHGIHLIYQSKGCKKEKYASLKALISYIQFTTEKSDLTGKVLSEK